MRTLFAVVFAIVSLTACGVEPTTGSIEESLKGGCRVVCPKCHPGEICPMIACVEDCAPAKQPCVDTVLCPINYAWSNNACSCVPSK